MKGEKGVLTVVMMVCVNTHVREIKREEMKRKYMKRYERRS